LWFYDFESFDERGTRLQLGRRPYGITMYAPEKQKPDAEGEHKLALTHQSHDMLPGNQMELIKWLMHM